MKFRVLLIGLVLLSTGWAKILAHLRFIFLANAEFRGIRLSPREHVRVTDTCLVLAVFPIFLHFSGIFLELFIFQLP